jgi:hypothetical protein
MVNLHGLDEILLSGLVTAAVLSGGLFCPTRCYSLGA